MPACLCAPACLLLRLRGNVCWLSCVCTRACVERLHDVCLRFRVCLNFLISYFQLYVSVPYFMSVLIVVIIYVLQFFSQNAHVPPQRVALSVCLSFYVFFNVLFSYFKVCMSVQFFRHYVHQLFSHAIVCLHRKRLCSVCFCFCFHVCFQCFSFILRSLYVSLLFLSLCASVSQTHAHMPPQKEAV